MNSCRICEHPIHARKTKNDEKRPNFAKHGLLYQSKKLRDSSTPDGNSGQDCVQARNKKNNEKSYVLRRQLVNPSQSHPSAASKQGREIGVGAI